ncbi:hypothetical protein ACERK3_18150 [Phycisphaerales bacterium AB-hyl4]|uniref:Uncharacterized protein n=1 Tax=Natronomicrosphaera hydrolytica TaxID=3242702 RepID=A0ABV4U9B1_9BACT
MGEHLQNFIDRVKQDRKLALMLVLLMVGLLLWGRLLLQPSVPRTATAEPSRATAVVPDSGSVVKASRPDRPVVEVELPDYLARDLFNFPSDEFAWAAPKKAEQTTMEEKSGSERSDDQLRSATVRKAAENLRLRSVMMGENPSAVINGQVLRPGQQIQGFTLLEIAKRHVLLEQHGVIVRLRL